MSALAHAAAIFCVAAGLVAGAAVAVALRDGRAGMAVGLDFWLAAGLVTLTTAEGWQAPLVAAVVLAVRQTAARALRSRGEGPPFGAAPDRAAPPGPC